MSVDASLVFYVVMFSIAALLMWWGISRKSKLIVGFSLIIPILLSALRFNVGTDYSNYVLMFKDLSLVPFDQYFTQVFPKIEIGFYALIKLSSWITNGPFLMFLGSSALIVLFFYFGLKKYNLKHPSLIYFLYLMVIFPTTLNGIRQGIAAAICFYAITFIISRRPGKYLFWVFIASLFHISALFLAPLYLLNIVIKGKNEESLTKILLIFSAVAVAMLMALPYLFEVLATVPIFETYVQYLVPVNDGTDSGLYSKLAITAIVIIAAKWVIPRTEKNKYNYFIVFALLEVLISTIGFSATIDRMALYFSFFSLFLIANFANVFKDTLGKIVVYSFIIIYGIAYFYLAYYVQNYGDVMPYQLIG